MAWPRRARRTTAILFGADVAAIAVPLGLLLVADVVALPADSVIAELLSILLVLVAIPALALLVPICLLVAAAESIPRRIYPDRPIVASWNVWADGRGHVVSLPEPGASPDYAWVDGGRVALRWVFTDAVTGWAVLDARIFRATLTTTTSEAGTTRYALRADRSVVRQVAVANGERRRQAAGAPRPPEQVQRPRLGRRRGPRRTGHRSAAANA